MDTPSTDFYACDNGHVGTLRNLAGAQRLLASAPRGRLAPLRELPGRIGRGFFCGICGSKMHPSAPPAALTAYGGHSADAP